MNRFLERSLRRGVAALAVGTALPVRLLLEALGEKGRPLLLISGAVIVSTWCEHLVPVLFAINPSALPADFFFVYPKDAFSGSGLEAPTLKRACATARSASGC